MKKTLKLVLIFIGGLTAIVISGLTGFLLITKNKTFYIYDVRLVEPNEGMTGYIYTDSEGEYTSIKNKVVYMNSKKNNLCPIAVYASASSNANDVKITSSDPSIAKIVYQDGGCYVQYLKEGFVTIESELYGVKDSFSIQIYDQIPSDFAVFDYEYYGDYAEIFPNDIVSYADEEEYRYSFYLNNASSTGANDVIDGDLIEIGEKTFNDGTFESVTIDSDTNELVVKCKKQDGTRTEDINDVIVIRPFFYDDNNEKVYGESYLINVYVVLYIPEFLQIEVSATPNFKESIVLTNTTIDSNFKENNSEDDIKNDKTLLKDYLSAVKAENYLAKNGESATYKILFTDRVKKIYFRPRMVYSNGDIVYLKNGTNSTIDFSNAGLCKLDPTGDYYITELNESNYFTSNSIESFNVAISLTNYGYDLKHTFKFVYRKSESANVNEFYDQDKVTKIYTYSYWDSRARFTNEFYDTKGNVIGFGW